MFVKVQRFFLLAVGFLFFIVGCGDEGSNIPIVRSVDTTPDTTQSSLIAEVEEMPTTDAQISFEQNLLPILRARCAFAGCHVAGGPGGLDFSTYQVFLQKPVFTPGNARSSDIIEEIVSGRMPPGGPRLPDAQIQLFIDWINQQAVEIFDNRGANLDDHDDDDDDHDDHDDDDHDHDDHDDDHDDHDD